MPFDPACYRDSITADNLGRQVYHYPSAPSTMDVAFQLADQGAQSGALVVADEQSAGRGRTGREWLSQKEAGLWFSLLLLAEAPCESVGILAPATGLALAALLTEELSLPARVKWPNDVRVNGKKIAGALVESRRQRRVIVIGVGLNLRLPSPLPEELAGEITALEVERPEAPPPEELLAHIMSRLEATLTPCLAQDTKAVVDEWPAFDEFIRRRVTVKVGRRVFTGADLGLAADGSLSLLTPHGLRLISAGELVGPSS